MKNKIEIITAGGNSLEVYYQDNREMTFVLDKDILVGRLNYDDVVELHGFLSQFIDQELDGEC